MVLVDTSIWIGLYRQRNSQIGELVWSLVAKNEAAICGQIYVEFIGGFRNQKTREEFSHSFLNFPFIEMTRSIYQLAAELLAQFPRLGAGDAIIAATAINSNTPLLTFDKDFLVLEKEGLQLLRYGT